MPRYKKHEKGFTLLELLISLSLMLILVGATVSIFVSSSDIIRSSETRLNVYQNATVAFETLSLDLAEVDLPFTLSNVQSFDDITESVQILLKFKTFTSWLNSSTGQLESGQVLAFYYIKKKTNGLVVLKRQLVDETDLPSSFDADDLDQNHPNTLVFEEICEYIAEHRDTNNKLIPSVIVDYTFFEFPNIVDSDSSTTPSAGWTVSAPSSIDFEEQSETLALNPPVIIRLTMNVTDEKKETTRKVSRYFQAFSLDSVAGEGG